MGNSFKADFDQNQTNSHKDLCGLDTISWLAIKDSARERTYTSSAGTRQSRHSSYYVSSLNAVCTATKLEGSNVNPRTPNFLSEHCQAYAMPCPVQSEETTPHHVWHSIPIFALFQQSHASVAAQCVLTHLGMPRVISNSAILLHQPFSAPSTCTWEKMLRSVGPKQEKPSCTEN